MTKEENLHWLNQEIRTWENECQSKHPIKEALYAARKALEQEPIKPMVEIDLYSVIKQKYIEREVLEKLRADIEAAYDELDGYDPDALGTFADRIADLIDNLLSESEVKANENEK